MTGVIVDSDAVDDTGFQPPVHDAGQRQLGRPGALEQPATALVVEGALQRVFDPRQNRLDVAIADPDLV